MARILAVNDDPVTLQLMESQLLKAGYDVLTAVHVRDAINLLYQHDVHLVISDVHLPDIDGWQFCKILKAEENDRFRNIPVLFVSATEWAPVGCRLAKHLEAAGFLEAPWHVNDLLNTVSAILDDKKPVMEFVTKVLIADDDDVVRRVLGRMLLTHGYAVDEAFDGQDCIEKILANPPHLLFVDHVMPRQKGLDVLLWVQQQGLNIPVVMITGAGSEELAVEAMKAGAYDYLIKPLVLSGIPSLCEDVLIRHQSNMISQEYRFRIKQIQDVESQLREAERLRVVVETAGAAAHEISQPLTGVLGWAEIMMREGCVSAEHLEKIQHEALRIRDILRRMATVSRYATRPYVGNQNIIDFKKASGDV